MCFRFLDTSFKLIEIDDNPQSESFTHDGEGNDDDGVRQRRNRLMSMSNKALPLYTDKQLLTIAMVPTVLLLA